MAGASLGSAASLPSFRHIIRLTPHKHYLLGDPSMQHLRRRRRGRNARYPPSLEVVIVGRPQLVFALIQNPGPAVRPVSGYLVEQPRGNHLRRLLPHRPTDGGSVALDWVSGDDRRLPAASPLLVLLVRALPVDLHGRRHVARDKGWRVVVFNRRGCGNSPATASQLYSASFIEDLREVVAHVSSRYPNANLYAACWGCHELLSLQHPKFNLVLQYSHTCPLSGAVSLGNPFNLVIADEASIRALTMFMTRLLQMVYAKFSRNVIGFLSFFKAHGAFQPWMVEQYFLHLTNDYQLAANDPIAPSRGFPHDDIKILICIVKRNLIMIWDGLGVIIILILKDTPKLLSRLLVLNALDMGSWCLLSLTCGCLMQEYGHIIFFDTVERYAKVPTSLDMSGIRLIWHLGTCIKLSLSNWFLLLRTKIKLNGLLTATGMVDLYCSCEEGTKTCFSPMHKDYVIIIAERNSNDVQIDRLQLAGEGLPQVVFL
ncbi:hypothetical protein RJ639_003467 [Escallonia herrerae]|uniref:Uncharacterized protein n=1 Tax=Escallonia herrerae TaxID=1293975 RepID=A0AA89AVW2_9ASTE|nr:hypothetical protein RJ639_003467 [Escallonia herrerae]